MCCPKPFWTVQNPTLRLGFAEAHFSGHQLIRMHNILKSKNIPTKRFWETLPEFQILKQDVYFYSTTQEVDVPDVDLDYP